MASTTRLGYDFCVWAAAQETDKCILWPYGQFRDGYGVVSYDKKTRRAHRLVCELAYGPPPFIAACAAHNCRNRHCINPRHVGWKTPKENTADRTRDGTDNCGSRNPKVKLTETQVREIRKRYKEGGVYQWQLAEEYGVAQSTIWNIVSGKTWAHLS